MKLNSEFKIRIASAYLKNPIWHKIIKVLDNKKAENNSYLFFRSKNGLI